MNDMIDNIRNILIHNNEGVDHITKGHCSAAKKAFRAALVELKDCEKRRQATQRPLEEPTCNTPSFPVNIEARSIPEFHDSQHYIFRNAVQVELDFNNDIKLDCEIIFSQVFAGLTAIVIFNLSLASHYNADRYNWHTDDLKQVIKFYTKAWEALHKDGSWLQTNHAVCRDMMLLAMLNNMGAIFHKLAKYGKATHCFKALRNVFSSKSAGVQALHPDEHYGMMMNAMFIDQPGPACAA